MEGHTFSFNQVSCHHLSMIFIKGFSISRGFFSHSKAFFQRLIVSSASIMGMGVSVTHDFQLIGNNSLLFFKSFMLKAWKYC